MPPHITRFVRTVVQLAKESVVARSKAAFEPGEGGFSTWVMLAINCYRERDEETYRSVVDKLAAFSELRELLELSLEHLPDPSTVCKAFDRLTAAICRRLLAETLE